MCELAAIAFRASGTGTMELARYRFSPLKRLLAGWSTRPSMRRGSSRAFLRLRFRLRRSLRLWYFFAIRIDMLELAAIVKLEFPTFTQRIARSKKRKRWLLWWRCGQRRSLGLARTPSTRSPCRWVPGCCCTIGGKFGLSSLLAGCDKRSPGGS